MHVTQLSQKQTHFLDLYWAWVTVTIINLKGKRWKTLQMKQVLPGSGVICQASAWKTPPTPFFIISQRRPVVCYWHHWKRMEPCAVPMVIDSIELESQINHLLREHYLRKLAFRFSYLLCCYRVGRHTWRSEDSSEKSVLSPTWVRLSFQFNAPPYWSRLSCFCYQETHTHVSIHMGTSTRAYARTHNTESKTKILKKEFEIILDYRKSLRVAWAISKTQTSNSIYLQCPHENEMGRKPSAYLKTSLQGVYSKP